MRGLLRLEASRPAEWKKRGHRNGFDRVGCRLSRQKTKWLPRESVLLCLVPFPSLALALVLYKQPSPICPVN
jgi:hypothetical protein